MNESITNIGMETFIKTALEGPHGSLAIVVAGIVAVFGLYLSHTAGATFNVDEREED